MTKTILEQRPALKHLMDIVQQSGRALRRLMAEARTSGDPAPMLRTALAEAANVSKAAVRLAVEIGRVHDENPSALRNTKAPEHCAAEVLERLDSILAGVGLIVAQVRYNIIVGALRDDPEPRQRFEPAPYGVLIEGYNLNRLDHLTFLSEVTELTEGEARDLRAMARVASESENHG